MDLNVVGIQRGEYIEIQGTGEKVSYTREQLNEMLDYADGALDVLLTLQNEVTNFNED